MSAKDFKHHMLNELRELERLIRNDCARDNGEFDSYEPEELKWFDKLHEMQELCEGKNADTGAEQCNLPVVKPCFSEITRETDSAFDWLFKENNHACDSANNSVMIRILAEKYNELAKFLNGA